MEAPTADPRVKPAHLAVRRPRDPDPMPRGRVDSASDDLDRTDETLCRQLDARILTCLAQPVDLEPTPHGNEAVFRSHPVLDLVELVALELGHRTALHTDHVFVNGVVGESMLVPLEPLPEVVLLHEPTKLSNDRRNVRKSRSQTVRRRGIDRPDVLQPHVGPGHAEVGVRVD